MKLTELTLLSLQTAFMQKDLTTQGLCAGLQGQLKDIAQSTYNILIYQALATMPESEFAHELVDELAWQFHTDYYDKTADYEIKKGLVKQSIKIHQKKGTPQAVIDLMQTAFSSEVYMLEWFNYGGKPYNFKIMTPELPSDENLQKFHIALASVKNARSFLDGVELFIRAVSKALSVIRNSRVIEYKANVGIFKGYEFKNTGEVLAFSIGEEIYSFVSTEVD